MPGIIADLVEGGPRLEGAEKVAPVSSRKLTGWPPTIKSPEAPAGGDEDRSQSRKPWALSVLILGLGF